MIDDPLTAATLEALRRELPGPGVLLADPDSSSLQVTRQSQPQSAAWSKGPENVAERALRVNVPKRDDRRYTWQVLSPNTREPIRKGDVIFVALWARMVESADESGEGRFSYRLQMSHEPWTGVFDMEASVGRDWRRLLAFGRASVDLAAGEAHLAFHLSFAKQTLEFGPVMILNMGSKVNLGELPTTPVTYPGREPDAAWRRRAEKDIEIHRKADLQIRVIDEQGKPVSSAALRIHMVRHAYQFGTFVGYRITEDSPAGERYRKFFLENFNAATAPIYWADWGWANPGNQEKYLRQIQWLRAQTIPTRGHNVIWPSWKWSPQKIRNHESEPHLLREVVRSHITDVLSATAPYGLEWYDLVNEPRDNHDLMDVLGPETLAEWFHQAHTLVPQARLFLNEFGIVVNGAENRRNIETYHEQIRALLQAGVPLGGIGLQCHFGSVLTDPAIVLEVLDEFAQHGLPIHITEFDIDINDKSAQADYTRDFLTAVFSHPATAAFVMWGFWEEDHWRPNGAMIRADWSLKPNYHAYRERIYRDWWTDEARTTDKRGHVQLRAFLGDYEISVKAGGLKQRQRVRLGPEGANLTLTLP